MNYPESEKDGAVAVGFVMAVLILAGFVTLGWVGGVLGFLVANGLCAWLGLLR